MILGAPTLAYARQLVAERPPVEVGARLAALADFNKSAIAGSPSLTWNLDRRTAIEVSADFSNTNLGYVRERQRIGYVQLKRTLFSSGSGRFFATGGAAAGTVLRTRPPYAYSSLGGVVVTGPAFTTTEGVGGLTVGAGYDRMLGNHLMFSAETQFVMRSERAVMRTLIGVSTPLGRYRRQAAASTSSIVALGHINVGDTVWVTTQDGLVRKGIVAGVSTSAIDLLSAGVTTPLLLEKVKTIETEDRVTDGLRRGALIGSSAGIPAAVLAVAICANEGGDCAGWGLALGLGWGGIGAGIGAVVGAIADSLHEGRRTVYSAPSHIAIAPVIAHRGAGVGAVIRW